MKKILTMIFATALSLIAKEAPVDAPRQESPKQEGAGNGESEKSRSQSTKEVAQISPRGYPSRVAPVVRSASTASRYTSVSRVNLRRATAKATTTVAPIGGSNTAQSGGQ